MKTGSQVIVHYQSVALRKWNWLTPMATSTPLYPIDLAVRQTTYTLDSCCQLPQLWLIY